MSKVFQFKQFSIDQTNCGMKVNTDAALLGALTDTSKARDILEIGTGTGVIALMLAQRSPSSRIDAVEIEVKAAATAQQNFRNSSFSSQISLINSSFEDHLQKNTGKQYDLIVSNPPYFINSLKSSEPSKLLARHTDEDFFSNLIAGASLHLKEDGFLYLILPLDTAELIQRLLDNTRLRVVKNILIHSFPDSKPYRCILVINSTTDVAVEEKFVIYESQNSYSQDYRVLLKDYLTIF
jgi:tRNA1Val (adenine37-N6)-methyltransferase